MSDDVAVQHRFLCECGGLDCRAVVMLTAEQFLAIARPGYILAPSCATGLSPDDVVIEHTPEYTLVADWRV